MSSSPSPSNRRRRRIVVVTIAVLVVGLGWWVWPRGDMRFVGVWRSADQTAGGMEDPNGPAWRAGNPVFIFGTDGSGTSLAGPWAYYRTGGFSWWIDEPVVLEETGETLPETLVLCFRSARSPVLVWFECLY